MLCYNCSSEKIKYDKTQDAYTCLQCGHVYPKEYWFISHSHLDIEKVRIIRDVIEEVFFYEPILFFLKCLSDDNEINNLIQREIAERIWFVYCQSQNAEKSKYVQAERDYLDQLIANGKKINKLQVDLDKFELWNPECKRYIRDQVFRGIRKDKLFLSYARADRAVVEEVYDHFTATGYNIHYLTIPTIAHSDFGFSVQDAIKAHSAKDGAVLAFISENSFASPYMLAEIDSAYEQNAVIIPVFIDEGDLNVKNMRTRLIERLPHLEKANYAVYDTRNSVDSHAKLEQVLKYFYIK